MGRSSVLLTTVNLQSFLTTSPETRSPSCWKGLKPDTLKDSLSVKETPGEVTTENGQLSNLETPCKELSSFIASTDSIEYGTVIDNVEVSSYATEISKNTEALKDDNKQDTSVSLLRSDSFSSGSLRSLEELKIPGNDIEQYTRKIQNLKFIDSEN